MSGSKAAATSSGLAGYLKKVTANPLSKNLPKLYSRNVNGSIQEWEVEVDKNRYRTKYGQQGGAVIVSDWTTCKGKNIGRANETSPEEQAFREAQSDWEKKAKTGYWEDINDIDKHVYVQVMLAHHLKDHKKKVKYPCIVQRKYNGGRCLVVKSGMWTRKGEEWKTAPHIYTSLEMGDIFVNHPQIKIDGELYNHEWRHELNKLMSIVRTKKKENITLDLLAQSQAEVKLYVYDGYDFTYKGRFIDESVPYHERMRMLTEILGGLSYIEMVPSDIAHSEKEIYDLYMSYIADGYEGAMVRAMNGEYEHKRSHTLLKVKPEDDDEFLIVSVQEGVGKFANRVATFTCKRTDGKKYADGTDTFDATIKCSEAIAMKIWQDNSCHKMVGKLATILYNGVTGYGKPNYARLDWMNYNKGDR